MRSRIFNQCIVCQHKSDQANLRRNDEYVPRGQLAVGHLDRPAGVPQHQGHLARGVAHHRVEGLGLPPRFVERHSYGDQGDYGNACCVVLKPKCSRLYYHFMRPLEISTVSKSYFYKTTNYF